MVPKARLSTSALRSLALLVIAFALIACGRRAGDPWDTGTVTLLVSKRGGPDVAEVVFENNKLIRVDYKTDEQPTRDRLKAQLDAIAGEAEREGLPVDFHGPDGPNGERGGFSAARPKPGAPQYARAVYHRLTERDFSARAK